MSLRFRAPAEDDQTDGSNEHTHLQEEQARSPVSGTPGRSGPWVELGDRSNSEALCINGGYAWYD